MLGFVSVGDSIGRSSLKGNHYSCLSFTELNLVEFMLQFQFCRFKLIVLEILHWFEALIENDFISLVNGYSLQEPLVLLEVLYFSSRSF